MAEKGRYTDSEVLSECFSMMFSVKIKVKVIRILNISEHTAACIQTWQEFKNFVKSINHSLAFTTSHFNFLIIVELAASHLLLQQPKQ